MGQLRSDELDVEGEFGDYRPLRALNHAFEKVRPDHIVIATRPLECSVWQRHDVVDRARIEHQVGAYRLVGMQDDELTQPPRSSRECR